MHLILTGATGLVGSGTLHAMLHTPSITRISILSRSPVAQATDTPEANAKCSVLTHSDFAQPPSTEMLAQLKDARGCIWAQGISQNDVDAQTYERITFDYPMLWALAFADAGLNNEGVFNFVYVSGEGATVDPGRFSLIFARVKGRTETALLDLSKQEAQRSFRAYSARPAGVDRANHPDIAKYMSSRPEGFAKKLEKPMLAMIRPVWKAGISPTKELGDALVMLASGDGQPLPEGPGIEGEGRTVRNIALRKMAGI